MTAHEIYDPVWLRARANHCRTLADTAPSAAIRWSMLIAAREYEADAANLEGAALPQRVAA